MANPIIEANNVIIGSKNILTGTKAIEYAAKHGLTINKFPDEICGPIFEMSLDDARDAIEITPALVDYLWVEAA
jgi:hypothetical protein